MIIRGKAPFRLGLAGGGTDISPYSETYKGAVLNATVSLYAWTTIRPRKDGKIIIKSVNLDCTEQHSYSDRLPYDGKMILAKGVYNVLMEKFKWQHNGFELQTETDVETGSGLGTSSTIVVSIIGAFLKWFNIQISQNKIAEIAFQIEREELKMAGGKQDQYTASFGGINFMEFGKTQVDVNPIKINKKFLKELNRNLILYYTNINRKSAKIIEEQIENTINKETVALAAMDQLKKNAYEMRDAFSNNDGLLIGQIINRSWQAKKNMAKGITNEQVDDIHKQAMKSGAIGVKISGAGGGGFMLFYVTDEKRELLISMLKGSVGQIVDYKFTFKGLESWVEK